MVVAGYRYIVIITSLVWKPTLFEEVTRRLQICSEVRPGLARCVALSAIQEQHDWQKVKQTDKQKQLVLQKQTHSEALWREISSQMTYVAFFACSVIR